MEKEIKGFNIGDEFKITDGMEKGSKIMLSEDAYVTVIYAGSKKFLKATVKNRDENPDMTGSELMIKTIAEVGIVDIKNVSMPDGTVVKNTVKSKMEMLAWKTDKHLEPPFSKMIVGFMRDLVNFPGSGKSLTSF